MAEEMAQDSTGMLAIQLHHRPRELPNLKPYLSGSKEAAALAARYRAFGLVVGIDLPHAGEVAQITTLTDDAMDAALTRLLDPGPTKPEG